MALLGVPTIKKWAKDVAKAVARPTAHGSPATPVITPIGIAIGPSNAVVPASDIKFVIRPEKKLIPTHNPRPLPRPNFVRLSKNICANHKAAPDSFKRAPRVRAPQYINHASQDMPPNIFLQSETLKRTGIRSASKAGPPRPSPCPPNIHRTSIRSIMPKVTFSA